MNRHQARKPILLNRKNQFRHCLKEGTGKTSMTTQPGWKGRKASPMKNSEEGKRKRRKENDDHCCGSVNNGIIFSGGVMNSIMVMNSSAAWLTFYLQLNRHSCCELSVGIQLWKAVSVLSEKGRQELGHSGVQGTGRRPVFSNPNSSDRHSNSNGKGQAKRHLSEKEKEKASEKKKQRTSVGYLKNRWTLGGLVAGSFSLTPRPSQGS